MSGYSGTSTPGTDTFVELGNHGVYARALDGAQLLLEHGLGIHHQLIRRLNHLLAAIVLTKLTCHP